MKTECQNVILDLPDFQKAFEKVKETFLTNLVMLSEIPAPTFSESERAKWLIHRLTEFEVQNGSIDEKGNAFGIIPGKSGNRNILIVAHMDTLFPETVDHNVTIHPDWVTGPGVSDNAVGLAALTTLPVLLNELNLELDSNLILMGSSSSLGHGDIEGIRFFLNNFKKPILAGLCLEGVKLGRLSYSSLGMLRGKITYIIPEEYDWTKFDSVGAIVNMNEMINRLLEIPLPRKPKTSIVLGSIEGGTGYGSQATTATLRFEIRSESDEMVENLSRKIRFLSEEMSSRSGALIQFEEVSRRKSGGTEFSHPLNIMAREMLRKLEIQPRITPSTSELSAFIDHEIPAITIGLTNGENLGALNETIQISPLAKGIAQFIGLLKAIDMGCCNE